MLWPLVAPPSLHQLCDVRSLLTWLPVWVRGLRWVDVSSVCPEATLPGVAADLSCPLSCVQPRALPVRSLASSNPCCILMCSGHIQTLWRNLSSPELVLCVSYVGSRAPVWPFSLFPLVHPGCPVLGEGQCGAGLPSQPVLVLTERHQREKWRL